MEEEKSSKKIEASAIEEPEKDSATVTEKTDPVTSPAVSEVKVIHAEGQIEEIDSASKKRPHAEITNF